MKNAWVLMPFIVLSLYFSPTQAKVMESTDPAYVCRVVGFVTRHYTNVVKIHEEVVIYPVQTTLFKAYGVSSLSNYFFQVLYSEKKQDELSYDKGKLNIKIKWNGVTELSIDEATGIGRVWHDEGAIIKLPNRPLIYDLRLDQCQKVPQEDLEETLVEFSFVSSYPRLSRLEVREDRRRLKQGPPKPSEKITGFDPLHE